MQLRRNIMLNLFRFCFVDFIQFITVPSSSLTRRALYCTVISNSITTLYFKYTFRQQITIFRAHAASVSDVHSALNPLGVGKWSTGLTGCSG